MACIRTVRKGSREIEPKIGKAWSLIGYGELSQAASLIRKTEPMAQCVS